MRSRKLDIKGPLSEALESQTDRSQQETPCSGPQPVRPRGAPAGRGPGLLMPRLEGVSVNRPAETHLSVVIRREAGFSGSGRTREAVPSAAGWLLVE
jgi:hypothetical protein